MIDTGVYWVRAEAAMRQGRWADALTHLRPLIEVVDRIDFEYDEWLRALAETYRGIGRPRAALTCQAYLGPIDAPNAVERARLATAAEEGDAAAERHLATVAIYLSRGGQHEAAVAWFDAAAMPVHEAIELERAGRDAEAAARWPARIEDDRLGDRPYELALAKLNYGLCLVRLGEDRARSALAEGTRAVEEVADQFESEGLRERAFDCYQLLARVGVETDAFENVAEGYLNGVRILRDDALKLDALRLYEAFIALAAQAKEHHAVATILREAAEYCDRVGLPYADDLRLRAGDAWVETAEVAMASGHPAQIVENAYLAAAEAFVSVRAFQRARTVYESLADLGGRAQPRYRRLLERLQGWDGDAPRPSPVPEFLKRPPPYEEVWYVDLAEWEIDGDPGLVAAGILADRRFPDYVRRHALLLVLEVYEADGSPPVKDVVARLQSIRAYPVIAALEQLYDRGSPALQRDVVDALRRLRFKRTFQIIERALRSPDSGVRQAAGSAVAELFFPHAFDRLRRIFESRDLDDDYAKVGALKAIGRINTPEALEFLCDRLREGDERFVRHAEPAIAGLQNADLVPYLKEQVDLVPPIHRTVLEDAAVRLSQHGR